jgi:RNA polymerase sigma-70 factor, ECF subfamily
MTSRGQGAVGDESLAARWECCYSSMSGSQAGELSVKRVPAIGWSEFGSSEAALVSRCAFGDEGACAELVAEHQRMVFQLGLHLLGDQDEALDLSQEVFLRIFRTIGRFRGQSALRTWIYRIVINQARNRQRWWKRRHRSEQVSLDEHLELHGDIAADPDGRTPDRILSQKELATRVWHALDHLPFDQRTAIVLREIDGLSYDEIAFSLGVAVGTVKSRLTRARGALRAQLREAKES